MAYIDDKILAYGGGSEGDTYDTKLLLQMFKRVDRYSDENKCSYLVKQLFEILVKLIIDWAGRTMLQMMLGMLWLPRCIPTIANVVRIQS